MSADLSAEQSVLGAMMLSSRAIGDATAIVTGIDFHRPDHEMIFDAVVDLFERNAPADPVTVAEVLAKSGDLARCGGAPYLHLLINSVPSPGMAAHYAGIVKRHAQLRQVGTLGTRLLSTANNPGTDLDDIPEMLLAAIRSIEDALTDIGHASSTRKVATLLDDVIDGIEHPDHTPVIRTGLHDLDDLYPGHAPGQLVVVGARPSVGKSVFALTLARNAAHSGVNTLFITLEMSATEIMQRLLAAESGVPLDHITKGACTDYDWDRIAAVNARIIEMPLYIDDTPSMGLPQIRQAAEHMHRDSGLGLLVVDYLQLMTAPRAENRQQQVAALSRGLKLLAGELGIPVIALAQLNRDSEKRSDKTPVMSDLRESGALEADADSILLLHRPELYGDESRAGECDVIVAKCRGGRPGTVATAFQGHYARCASFASEPRTPYSAMNNAA